MKKSKKIIIVAVVLCFLGLLAWGMWQISPKLSMGFTIIMLSLVVTLGACAFLD